MAAKKGSLSISSENIFPIIKKWVYSDHDIFVREMVSNGCDAITKLKSLRSWESGRQPDGYEAQHYRLTVDSRRKDADLRRQRYRHDAWMK
ncbi:MAG: hypothetical protein ACLTT1_11465 [[Clostridium] scindens]